MADQYCVWYRKTKYLALQPCVLPAFALQPDHPLLPPKETLPLVVVGIMGGEATISIDGNRYTAAAGDFFVAAESENARIHAVLSEKLDYWVLSFVPAFVSPNGPMGFDQHYLSVFSGRQNLPTHKLSGQRQPLDRLSQLFSVLTGRAGELEGDFAWYAKVHLLEILLEIRRYYQEDGQLNLSQQTASAPPNQMIERIISYIDENLAQSLSLSMFAEIAHMDPFYFSTYFKKHTSMSPSQYVLYARINRAKKLLVETDKNILDVALLCGFNSTANFNKAFKKVVGMTPSEYRGSLE